MAKFIEFYGLPGSGKTTLVRELRRKCKDDEVTGIVFYVGPSKFSFYHHCRKIGSVLYALFTSIIKQGRAVPFYKMFRSMGIRLLYNYLWVYSIYLRYHKRKEVVVFDQGMVQLFWSALYDSKNNLPVHNFNKSYEVYHVNVTVPYKVWSDRLKNRPSNKSRADNVTIDKRIHKAWSQNMVLAQACWYGQEINIEDIRKL